MTTPLRPRITGCEHEFDSVVQCPTCGVPNTMVQWRLEAEAAPDLRAAANYVVDVWADLSQEDCSGTNAMDDAVDRLHRALAAPAADGLDVDEEDVIDRAVPPIRELNAPRTKVIRSIVTAIHEQGYAVVREPSREPGEEADDIAHAVEGTDR